MGVTDDDLRDLDSSLVQEAQKPVAVEDVVMQEPRVQVVSPCRRPFPMRGRVGISRSVVEPQGLVEMCQVVLAGAELPILNQVLDRSDRALTIEGPLPMRRDHQYPALTDKHAAPVCEGPEGIREVLYDVRAEDDVEGVLG